MFACKKKVLNKYLYIGTIVTHYIITYIGKYISNACNLNKLLKRHVLI